MFNICIIAEEGKLAAELRSQLGKIGFACSIADCGDEGIRWTGEQAPDLVLVDIDSGSKIIEVSRTIRQSRQLPVIALTSSEALDSINGHLGAVDDFVLKPYDLRELELRIKRLLHGKTQRDDGELARCGDLVVDLARCEVSLAGKEILLTFKEYELLKFLATNRGRVFTREALLSRVWGYDYFGGDRTVDVHIRRLRSKIEDSSHAFVETVRNIGYRFKKDA